MSKKQQPKQPTEQDALEAKVDAMMAVDRAKKDIAMRTKQPQAAEELPPLDIFNDPKTAPEVPKDLLQHLEIKKSAPADGSASEPTIAQLATVTFDDPVIDAAVDAIEAEEDTTPEDEAAEQPEATTGKEAPEARKLHHHPLFWTLVFILALVAVVLAYLLVTGGNVHLPGVLQRWVDKLQQ